MPFSNATKAKLLNRVLTRAYAGEMNLQNVLLTIVGAIGSSLDSEFATEAQKWLIELNQNKTTSQTAITAADATIAELQA